MALGSVDWESRTLRKPDRPLVEWLRMGTLNCSECTIGILRSGTWVVDTADGLADLSDSRALTFVLPLLKLDLTELRSRLEAFLLEHGFDSKLVDTFPLARLIVYAVEHDGYWAEQSFRWLQEIVLGESDRTKVIEALKQIERNKDLSQRLRHDAMKHRFQLERKAS